MSLIPVSQKNGFFTMLELLLVIAVIMILSSILLPALSTARERAKGIACIGNIKQIGLAINFYMEDNNNHYPFCQNPLGGDPKPFWQQTIASYLDARLPSPCSEEDLIKKGQWIFWCPSNTVSYADPNSWRLYKESYGANVYAIYGIDALKIGKKNIFLFAEASFHYITVAPSYNWQNFMKFPHRACSNTLFYDNHIAPLRISEMKDSFLYPIY